MKKTIILTGATSSIGGAIIKEFAKNNFDLILLGRDKQELEKIASDASIRYQIKVKYYLFDSMELDQHEKLMHKIKQGNQNVSGIIIAHGYMDKDDGLNILTDSLERLVKVNYTSIITLTSSFAKLFNKKGNFVAVITSIAGDRGKARNVIYGSAKGAASRYLEGFRQAAKNLTVIDIKPGFVDTPMTYGYIDSPLIDTREKVAKDIYKAIKKRKRVVYTPFFWRYIMFILKNLPGIIYDKLKL